MRIGHGYDAHRFSPGRRLVLGGVEIDYELGMAAHSDGDVAIHALCDAILGALALGDIGKHFPDTDPTLEGVDSRLLLRHVVSLMQAQGHAIANVDVTIAAQAPRLAPHIPQMRERLTADLGCQQSQVNVKATTTEGMGFVGRREGIEAHAVVLLMPFAD
jgi:2-C-methyl-D-erythritol 2,4-cyclodiphosphate synthase